MKDKLNWIILFLFMITLNTCGIKQQVETSARLIQMENKHSLDSIGHKIEEIELK